MKKLSEIYKEKIIDNAINANSIYDYDDFIEGSNHALDTITPEICIAFAEWIDKNNYMIEHDKLWHCLIWEYKYTTQDLFQEFLKQYKP